MIGFTTSRQVLLLLCASISAMLTCSCSESERTVYSHFEQIGSDGWDPMDILQFEPEIAERIVNPKDSFDVKLVARYSNRVEPSNLLLVVTVEEEDETISSDTLAINPCAGSGIVLGKPYHSELKLGTREVNVLLNRSLGFPEGIRYSISTLGNRNLSKGLLNVGIVVQRVKRENDEISAP